MRYVCQDVRSDLKSLGSNAYFGTKFIDIGEKKNPCKSANFFKDVCCFDFENHATACSQYFAPLFSFSLHSGQNENAKSLDRWITILGSSDRIFGGF